MGTYFILQRQKQKTDIKDRLKMHSNIKVGTIVNIINVYNRYIDRIAISERKYDYYKSIGDKTGLLFAEIELKKDSAKLSEFLDYYV